MILWRNPTTSSHSLQRSKSSISIITNQLSIEGSHFTQLSILSFFHSKGRDPKTPIPMVPESGKKSSKSIPNQGVKVRTSTFKISNKVETNSKNRDIVSMKIPRFVEQGFYDNSKTLRRAISN